MLRELRTPTLPAVSYEEFVAAKVTFDDLPTLGAPGTVTTSTLVTSTAS